MPDATEAHQLADVTPRQLLDAPRSLTRQYLARSTAAAATA